MRRLSNSLPQCPWTSVFPTLTLWQAIVTALISFSTKLELKIIYLLLFRIPQTEGRQQCRFLQDGADSGTGLWTHSSGETSYAWHNFKPFWSMIWAKSRELLVRFQLSFFFWEGRGWGEEHVNKGGESWWQFCHSSYFQILWLKITVWPSIINLFYRLIYFDPFSSQSDDFL